MRTLAVPVELAFAIERRLRDLATVQDSWGSIDDAALSREYADALAALLAAPGVVDLNEHDGCHCVRCLEEAGQVYIIMTRMLLCPTCGNKRCPKASDHRFVCTGSNQPGQVGVLETPAPEER